VTKTYGIEIISINIISAAPVDQALTKSLTLTLPYPYPYPYPYP